MTAEFAFTALRGALLPSVAKLRLLNGEAGQVILLAGHTSADDGGGGWFHWEVGVTTGDDGGLVVVPNTPRGRWVRVYDGPIHAAWFGFLPGLGALLPKHAELQDALDAAEGESLWIRQGNYHVDDSSLPRSSTTISGAGVDKTNIVGTEGAYNGVNAVATAQYATFACIGVNNVEICNLTVDHATLDTEANGIIAVPTGAEPGGVGIGLGTVCTNIKIHHVKVLLWNGAGTEHSYGIWLQRCEDFEFHHCRVDGGITALDAASQQEGFEIWGGRRGKAWANVAINIGNAGFNITPAVDVANSSLNGLQMWGNHAENCRQLYYLGTAYSVAGGAANMRNVLFSGNTGANGWYYGVHVKKPIAGTTLINVQIAWNIIDACREGITIFGIEGETGDHAVAVNDNTITGSTTTDLGGLTAVFFANLQAHRNKVYLSSGAAIWMQGLLEPDFDKNEVDTCVFEAIRCVDCDDISITRSRCKRYSNANGLRIGILVTGAQSGVVNDSVMSQSYTHTDIRIDNTSDDIQMRNPQALHSPTAVTPFVNDCTNPRAA